MVKLTLGGSYLKPSEAKPGVFIEFLNEGEWETSDKYTYENGDPKKSFVMKVKYNGEEKKLRMNAASRRAMIDVHGEETAEWVGKKAKIVVLPTPNGQNKMIMLEVSEAGGSSASAENVWDD